MGWSFPWYSSLGSDFDFDYRRLVQSRALGERRRYCITTPHTTVPCSDLPGASVFFKDGDGSPYRAYSTYSRGLDMLMGASRWPDIVPKGRDEAALERGA